jgi:hypothetical protein
MWVSLGGEAASDESAEFDRGEGARVGVNKISPAMSATHSTTPRSAMSIDFPKEEERILKRWDEINAFLTQIELVCRSSAFFVHGSRVH